MGRGMFADDLRAYDEALSHHGIIGQKWGVKHGPPYPLDNNVSTGRKLKTSGGTVDDGFQGVKRLHSKREVEAAQRDITKKRIKNQSFYREGPNGYKIDVAADQAALHGYKVSPKDVPEYDIHQHKYIMKKSEDQYEKKPLATDISEITRWFKGAKAEKLIPTKDGKIPPDDEVNFKYSYKDDGVSYTNKELSPVYKAALLSFLKQNYNGTTGVLVIGATDDHVVSVDGKAPSYKQSSDPIFYSTFSLSIDNSGKITSMAYDEKKTVDKIINSMGMSNPNHVYYVRTDNCTLDKSILKDVVIV